MILLLRLAGVLQLPPLRAGGPINVLSLGVAPTWGPTSRASITVDTGALARLEANFA